MCMCVLLFFFELYGDHPDLHLLTNSFPTLRSSDLTGCTDRRGGDPAASPCLTYEIVFLVWNYCCYGPCGEDANAPSRKYADAPNRAPHHAGRRQIGRAHVCTPVTNAHLVCRLLLDKKNHIRKTHYKSRQAEC